jgi:hypothetical protein
LDKPIALGRIEPPRAPISPIMLLATAVESGQRSQLEQRAVARPQAGEDGHEQDQHGELCHLDLGHVELVVEEGGQDGVSMNASVMIGPIASLSSGRVARLHHRMKACRPCVLHDRARACRG